jgi:peptidoglycan/LPS O-acetylase OafA/YrhL
MAREPFVTPPVSIALDAIRFASALAVLLTHAGEMLGVDVGLSQRWSHYAVILFFVLSGLVIDAASAQRCASLTDYAVARIARIMPVAVPAVILSALVYAWGKAQAGPLPDGFAGDLALTGLGGLVFLPHLGPLGGVSVPGNVPYWSLCYEVAYYALFGAAMFLKGPRRLLVLGAIAVLAGREVLVLLPVWLLGVCLNRSAWPQTLTPARGLVILVGCVVAVVKITRWDLAALVAVRELVPFPLGMSEWVGSDYAMGMVFAAGIAAVRPLAIAHAAFLERWAGAARYGSGFSYSLYLFHAPLVLALTRAGFDAQGSVWRWLAVVAAVLAACALIAVQTERRSPALRRAMLRWIARETPPERLASPA